MPLLNLFTYSMARDAYPVQLKALLDYGDRTDVRGRTTLEFINAVTEINEPIHHCILIPERHWNPWLAMSEFLWIMAGRNDVAALKPYNRNIVKFSDDGEHLYGAYGARITDQIDDLIERLRRDPSDRRAVLSIWRPDDLTVESKDPPCNNLVYFKLRQGKLHMTVICRSNDIHWGLYAVNIPTFGMLQVYLAARLGVDVGVQTHFSNSLHVYTDDKRAQEITDRMLYERDQARPIYPSHEPIFRYREMDRTPTHNSFAKACNAVLEAGNSPPAIGSSYPLFLAFAGVFLRTYRERDRIALDNLANTFPEFQDWILAGKIFADKVWGSVSQPRSA